MIYLDKKRYIVIYLAKIANSNILANMFVVQIPYSYYTKKNEKKNKVFIREVKD